MNDIYVARCRRLLECQITSLTEAQAHELQKLIERKLNAAKAQSEPASTRSRTGTKG